MVILILDQRPNLLPDELPKSTVGITRERARKREYIQSLPEGVNLAGRHLMLRRIEQIINEGYESRLAA